MFHFNHIAWIKVDFSFLLSKKVELSNSKVGPLLTRLLDAF